VEEVRAKDAPFAQTAKDATPKGVLGSLRACQPPKDNLRVDLCYEITKDRGDESMTSTADLELAVGFVTARIAEEAERSGAPLSEEQRLLLKWLPTESLRDLGLEFPQPVPRDQNLERVCALSRVAYQHDLQMNPNSRGWEFGLAVFTLYKHPMSGLLQWAGVKLQRPKWDRLLLLVAGLLPLAAVAVLVWSADASIFRALLGGVGCVAIAGLMVLVFLAAKRRAKQRLQEDIEAYRRVSGVGLSATR
jgi:hypothetical protein